MSKENFESLIKEAEEGEFMSEKELDRRFEEWKLRRKK